MKMDIISLKQSCATLFQDTQVLKSAMTSFIHETTDWFPHVIFSPFPYPQLHNGIDILHKSTTCLPGVLSQLGELQSQLQRATAESQHIHFSLHMESNCQTNDRVVFPSSLPLHLLQPLLLPLLRSSSRFFLLGSSTHRMSTVWRYVASKLLRACDPSKQQLQEHV